VLFRFGQLSAWWHTDKVRDDGPWMHIVRESKNAAELPKSRIKKVRYDVNILRIPQDGCIQRHTSQSTSIEAVRKRMMTVAQEDAANYSKFVCISWLGG
jgi:hypothetical protein